MGENGTTEEQNGYEYKIMESFVQGKADFRKEDLFVEETAVACFRIFFSHPHLARSCTRASLPPRLHVFVHKQTNMNKKRSIFNVRSPTPCFPLICLYT